MRRVVVFLHLIVAVSLASAEPPATDVVRLRPFDEAGAFIPCARLSCADGPRDLGADDPPTLGSRSELEVDISEAAGPSVTCRVEAPSFMPWQRTVLTGRGVVDFGAVKLVRATGLKLASGVRTESSDGKQVILEFAMDNVADQDVDVDTVELSGAAMLASTAPTIPVTYNFSDLVRFGDSAPSLKGGVIVEQAMDKVGIRASGSLTEVRHLDIGGIGSPIHFQLAVGKLVRFSRGARQTLRLVLPALVRVEKARKGEPPERHLLLDDMDIVRVGLKAKGRRLSTIEFHNGKVTERTCE